ncbi:MAG: hypothetical protein LBT30_06015 [Clostridiales bacterium]|jgi:hypothetical protein|nr:hypothetical protein [Clostridiales bacterium]
MGKIIAYKTTGYSERTSAVITNYKWTDNGYAPAVKIFLSYDDKSLKVHFEVSERKSEPRYRLDGLPVFKDSAVEVFLKPFNDDVRYLNCEFNSVCAAVLGFGGKKENRESLIERYKKDLNAAAFCDSDKWSIFFEIPYRVIGEIYGREFLPHNETVTANFFKCGDETEYPHFGMLFDVISLYPEFHLPQYFGRLIFE